VLTWQRVFVSPGAVAWAVSLVCAGAIGLAAWWIIYGRIRDGAAGRERVRALMPGLIALGVGTVTIAAGYIPLLPVAMSMAVNGVASRINAAAAPGAASALAGLLWIWSFALPVPRRWNDLLFGGLLALVIAVTTVHTVHLGNAMIASTDHHPCSDLRYRLPCAVNSHIVPWTHRDALTCREGLAPSDGYTDVSRLEAYQ
jgi:hypothetical protein